MKTTASSTVPRAYWRGGLSSSAARTASLKVGRWLRAPVFGFCDGSSNALLTNDLDVLRF